MAKRQRAVLLSLATGRSWLPTDHPRYLPPPTFSSRYGTDDERAAGSDYAAAIHVPSDALGALLQDGWLVVSATAGDELSRMLVIVEKDDE